MSPSITSFSFSIECNSYCAFIKSPFEANIVDYNTLDIYKEYKFKFFDINVFKEEKK